MSRVQADRDAGRTIYSVGDITRHIKLELERTFANLWIEGELSNVKRHSSGHMYFTLKDDKAQLPAVMFRGSARHLRFRPEDGTAVLAWGHITVYEPRGAYQIQVERMEPRGKGALQLAFEQLKEKLAKEGLFAEKRKKPLVYYLALWPDVLAAEDVFAAPVWMAIAPDGRIVGREPQERVALVSLEPDEETEQAAQG